MAPRPEDITDSPALAWMTKFVCLLACLHCNYRAIVDIVQDFHIVLVKIAVVHFNSAVENLPAQRSFCHMTSGCNYAGITNFFRSPHRCPARCLLPFLFSNVAQCARLNQKRSSRDWARSIPQSLCDFIEIFIFTSAGRFARFHYRNFAGVWLASALRLLKVRD